MPWSNDFDPPPDTPKDRRAAITTRIMILIVFGFIVGWCARSWFPGSAVDQAATGEESTTTSTMAASASPPPISTATR